MSNQDKTHSELIEEISLLRQKIQDLEKKEAWYKKTQDDLRASEEKYRILLSDSPDPTFSFTPQGQYTYVNRAFASGVGKPVEDIIGKTIWDVFSRDEAEKRFKPLSEVFRTGIQKVIEVRVPRPDGDRYYVTTITPVKNEKDETRSVICSSKDITERKRMQDHLAESEARFRNLAENARDMIYSMSLPDGKYEYVSPASLTLTGYSPQEFYENPLLIRKVIHPDSLDYLAREWEKLAGGEASPTYEYKIIAKSGEEKWFFQRNTIVTGSDGRAAAIEGIVTDITDRKLMEERLGESEVRFRTQYQNNPVPTFTWQRSGDTFILKDYNIAADILTRGDAAKFLNITAAEMYQNRPEVLSDMIRCFEEKTVVRRELVSENFKTPRIMIATWVFVQPDLVMAYLDDITRRRTAEEEQRRLQRRLQQAEKMEALGTLAGGVAHDLNNILGILVGYSELLLVSIPAGNPLRNHVEKMMQGGVRAAAIVQDLLTLARRGIQSQNVINLNAIIAEYQNTPEFEHLRNVSPGVSIQIKLARDLLNIKGSPSHISKTLMNLLTNAVEAMPGGGQLTVTTSNRHLDRPVQGYDDVREGDYVTLIVSDTGEGIAEEDLKHIFEPFYTKKVMGRSGTGLGLAVVWGTVKDHQGYIDVQSEKGKGTTVTLYLPVTRQEVTASKTALPLSEYLGREEAILVVDDIKEQRELASIMLGNLNYKVTTVASGEEAVDYLKTHQADLVVLDMIMDPGMDGLDTYKRILEVRPKQKAIIVSGFSETDRVLATQALGAGAYLRKPYIMEKLGITVRHELDRTT